MKGLSHTIDGKNNSQKYETLFVSSSTGLRLHCTDLVRLDKNQTIVHHKHLYQITALSSRNQSRVRFSSAQ